MRRIPGQQVPGGDDPGGRKPGTALDIGMGKGGIRSPCRAEFGIAAEARAMLEKTIAAIEADKSKALDMINKGEG
jgi:hypothetical protein